MTGTTNLPVTSPPIISEFALYILAPFNAFFKQTLEPCKSVTKSIVWSNQERLKQSFTGRHRDKETGRGDFVYKIISTQPKHKFLIYSINSI
jgi:hypothetical protein